MENRGIAMLGGFEDKTRRPPGRAQEAGRDGLRHHGRRRGQELAAMHPILADRRRLFAYLAAWELLAALLAAAPRPHRRASRGPRRLALALPLGCALRLRLPGRLLGVPCRPPPALRLPARAPPRSWRPPCSARRCWLAGARGLGRRPRARPASSPGLARRAAARSPPCSSAWASCSSSSPPRCTTCSPPSRPPARRRRRPCASRSSRARPSCARCARRSIPTSSSTASTPSTPSWARPARGGAAAVPAPRATSCAAAWPWAHASRVPFSEELALAEDLLAIEQVRFGDAAAVREPGRGGRRARGWCRRSCSSPSSRTR